VVAQISQVSEVLYETPPRDIDDVRILQGVIQEMRDETAPNEQKQRHKWGPFRPTSSLTVRYLPGFRVRLNHPVKNKYRRPATRITEIPIVRDVTAKFGHPLQNHLMALAVRAAVPLTFDHSSRRLHNYLSELGQKKDQKVVSSAPGKEPLSAKRREENTKQQQNQRNDNPRIIRIEVESPLPKLQFHRESRKRSEPVLTACDQSFRDWRWKRVVRLKRVVRKM
jgi:hypothetical protein